MMITTPKGRAPEWTPLQRYVFQLGHLAERRLSEAALLSAKRETDRANTVLRAEIEQRERAQAELEHLARHDVLTDLPNRMLFAHRLQQNIAGACRQGTSLAVHFVDLDHFKDVNDTLGHHAGDAVLTEVATRLRACVRGEDTVARLGGDEFAIIQVSPEGRDAATALANRVLAALAEPVEAGRHKAFVGGSIGIAMYPHDAEDAARLQRNADLAMYRAKNERRNTFCFFDSSLDDEAQRRAWLEQEMRAALRQGAFALYYQPKVCVRSDRIVGAEALLRWHHRDGAISPGEFIPLAERCGLISELGDWTLNEACTRLRDWQRHGLDVKVAINLSPAQFKTGDLVGRLRDVLARTGVRPGTLELEITETAVMRDMRDAARVLEALRREGVSISIDDFGTGYSSLSYLGELPVDRLKIDRSFVSEVEKKPAARAIARAVASLGRTLGLQTVAEGVETERQYAFVRELDCDEAQGFLFGAAAAADEFEALAASGRAEIAAAAKPRRTDAALWASALTNDLPMEYH